MTVRDRNQEPIASEDSQMTTLAHPQPLSILRPSPLPESVTIAVDTEYHGPRTLTVQAATRLGRGVALQVYFNHRRIPAPPPLDIDSQLQQGHRRLLNRVVTRPARS